MIQQSDQKLKFIGKLSDGIDNHLLSFLFFYVLQGFIKPVIIYTKMIFVNYFKLV